MTRPIPTERIAEAFKKLGLASNYAAAATELFGEQFHAELIARGIPVEILSDPEYQRRVRAALADDPSLSLSGHMLEIAAAMHDELGP